MNTCPSCRKMSVILLRTFGKVPIIFTVIIIMYMYLISTFVILPSIYSSLILRICLTLFSTTITIVVLYYFFKTIVAPFVTLNEYLEKNLEGFKQNGIYCNKCCLRTPDHAHHCSVCGCCIMNHDHHCIFLNRCVGDGNIQYFRTFINSCIVATGSNFLATLPRLVGFFNSSSYQVSMIFWGITFSTIFLNFVILVFTITMKILNGA